MLTLTNMPKPTKPPVRQKRAKSEVQEEFEEIRRGVEAARESADPKAEEAARLRADEIRHAVDGASVEGVVQTISGLGLEISKALSDISGKLTQEVERLLPFLVFLLLQPKVFLVLVLSLLALKVLLVFVLFDFAQPGFLQALFLLFALPLGIARLLFPHCALRGDFGFQPLLFARVILHQLVERRGGDVDLVQPR